MTLQRFGFFILSLTIFASCGNYEELKSSPTGSGFGRRAVTTNISFAQVKEKVLQERCISCHEGYHTDYVDYNVVIANLEKIVNRVNSNSMPKDGPLSSEEKAFLFEWINGGAPEDPNVANSGELEPIDDSEQDNDEPEESEDDSTNNPEPVAISFEDVRINVLEVSCTSCHSGYSNYQKVKGDIDFIRDAIETGDMPLRGSLTQVQKDLIFNWIDQGAIEKPGTGPIASPIVVPIPVEDKLVPKWGSISRLILQKKCTTCHNPTGRARFLDLSTLEGVLTSKDRQFDFKDSDNSLFIKRLRSLDRPMPPVRSNLEALSEEEVRVVSEWIALGLPE